MTSHLLKKRQQHRRVPRTLGTAAAAVTTIGLVLAGPGVAYAAGPSGGNGSNTSAAPSKGDSASSAKAADNSQNSAKSPAAKGRADKTPPAGEAATAAGGSKANTRNDGDTPESRPGTTRDEATPVAGQGKSQGSSQARPQSDAPSESRGKSQGKTGGTSRGNGSKGTQGGAANDVPGSPPGNNGTVKIAPYGAMDDVPNNTPHPGCQFTVEWYGFDEGEDIVSVVDFAAHAPTADAGISVTGDTSVFVGGSPGTGAGNNGLDGRQTYTLSFTGEPHPKQGYHVKLTVTTPRSNGNDTKTKVFWVEACEPPADGGTDGDGDGTGTGGEGNGTGGNEAGDEGTGTGGNEAGDEGAGTDGGLNDTDNGGQVGGEETAADTEGTDDVVAGVEGERTEDRTENQAGDVEVAGVSASRGAAPTGVAVPTAVAAGAEGSSNPLTALLLALGASLAAAGAWILGRGGRFRGVGQQ